MADNGGSILSYWPKDTTRSLTNDILTELITPEHTFFFADDAEIENGRNGKTRKIYYGVGISHVSVSYFMKYQISINEIKKNGTSSSNGSLKKLHDNLDWTFVQKHSERTSILAHKLISIYSSFKDNIAAIFVCTLFEDSLEEAINGIKSPHASSVLDRLHFPRRNYMKNGHNVYIPCRYFAYKQAVGRNVLQEMMNYLDMA